VCKAQGLTGEQGVLIPAANVSNLMLRQEVVDAAEAKQFHIYPIETIDQMMSLLTDLPAGERDKKGKFPKGSVNYKVEKRLLEFAKRIEPDHKS